jgi:hypothetical protein
MAELGWVAPQGLANMKRLAELVEDPASDVSEAARPVLRLLLGKRPVRLPITHKSSGAASRRR